MVLAQRLVVLFLTSCLVACCAAGRADDFRIETRLFVDDGEEPVSQNTTLFHNGVAYDYLTEPDEVTVFDPARGAFALLDKVKHLRTEITSEHIDSFSQKLQGWASGHEDPFLQFLAKPEFKLTSESRDKLTFSSAWLTYQIEGEPNVSPDCAQQFASFSDWCVRLNAMTNMGLLPFARLRVNEELRQRHIVPRQVELVVADNARFPRQKKAVTYRSEHHITWRLSKSDLKRIDQTGEDLVSFTPISFQQYRAASNLELGEK